MLANHTFAVCFTAVLALTGCGADFAPESEVLGQELKGTTTRPVTTTAPSYALKSTDSYLAGTTPTWKTSYPISTTYNVYIATEITGTLSGHHAATVFLFMPNGIGYQRFDVRFATDVTAGVGEIQAEKTATGYRIWVSLPVAGTMIETSHLVGAWTNEVWIDSATAANAKGGFSLL